MDFCIYDDMLDTIQITDKKLLHFKFSKLGPILHVDKTAVFPGPVTYFMMSCGTGVAYIHFIL